LPGRKLAGKKGGISEITSEVTVSRELDAKVAIFSRAPNFCPFHALVTGPDKVTVIIR
jgi:hypothetical protein